MQSEFIFKSKFSMLIRKIFTENKMFIKTVAKNMGCDVLTISAYYNDKKILTAEHAQAFSELLKILNVHYSADELVSIQRQAEFIANDNRSMTEILGLKLPMEQSSQTQIFEGGDLVYCPLLDSNEVYTVEVSIDEPLLFIVHKGRAYYFDTHGKGVYEDLYLYLVHI